MKILVVDDSINDFKLAEKIYQSNKDVHVTHAKNGIQGLHMLNKEELPDIILLDIAMPQLDGMEFLRRIRTFDVLKEIKVIITSAMKKEDYPELKELNITNYQQKPIPIETYKEFLN